MAKQNSDKLNYLLRALPEGFLVDSRWMEQHGYSTSLRSQYVSSGWLVKPTRGTFKRPSGALTWQKVVLSLQNLLGWPMFVGGRTALELQGFAHYVSTSGPAVVHLYGFDPPPRWLASLPLPDRFQFHRSGSIFKGDALIQDTVLFGSGSRDDPAVSHRLHSAALRELPGGDWTMVVSTPERALLEHLDELPGHETFHQVDMMVEGMRTLSPRRLQKLLSECTSVKVKRLLFWFAERHGHPWLEQIDRSTVSLGSGKRVLVKGGRLDPKYLITIPEDIHAAV